MEAYVKHRKSLESKSKKKDHSSASSSGGSSSSTSNPSKSADSDSFKDLESRMSSNMMQMFESFLDRVDSVMDEKINRSLPAPLSVPEPASKGGTGGNVSRQRMPVSQRDGTSGVVPISSSSPLPSHDGMPVDFYIYCI